MKFASTFVLHADERVDYTEDTVEQLVDALYEIGALLEVDVAGSLADRELTVEVVVEADSIEEAQACVTSSLRRALMDVGGMLAADEAVRRIRAETRELATS